MYIVGSHKGGKPNAQIANTVFQVTAVPITLAVSINKLNFTHECISESKVFSVSAFSREATMPFIGKFGFKSGRDTDKFAGTKYKTGVTGAPIVTDYTVAFFEAEVVVSFDCGTHTLFLGRLSKRMSWKKRKR